MFQFIHILISLILVHALFVLTVYKETDNKHTNKQAYDYKTGTENTPGATIIPMTTLSHEQSTKSQEEPSVSVRSSTKSQECGHGQPTQKRD